jgi:predicted transcriptional regulator
MSESMVQAQIRRLESHIAALRAENERLKKEKRELVEAIKESIKTCNGINTADYRTWEDGLNTKDEFIVWSKSRCGWQSDRLTAALEGKE